MNNQAAAVLAGDIGGTKTHLAIFSSMSDLQAPLAEATFASKKYSSLEVMVREFLSRADMKVDRAAFGVAGPVLNGQAEITNLPWVMEETRLADDLDLASVHLLNDLLAVAYAVPSLNGSDLHTLNKGQAAKGGTIAVVAPGTGLGEAYLIWDGAGYRAHPSEGGHADFAPNNTLEAEMLMHLRKHFEHVSYERVCSGSGLPNIYAFLKDSGHAEEPDWLADQLAAAHDPTPVIITAALDLNRPCRLCQATLNIFVSILGAETGNMALKVMASGGVYLGGGIPPRIISTLQSGIFMEAFGRKGRMSRLMTEVPVYVIMNPKAALWGAACQAFHPREHANVEMKPSFP